MYSRRSRSTEQDRAFADIRWLQSVVMPANHAAQATCWALAATPCSCSTLDCDSAGCRASTYNTACPVDSISDRTCRTEPARTGSPSLQSTQTVASQAFWKDSRDIRRGSQGSCPYRVAFGRRQNVLRRQNTQSFPIASLSVGSFAQYFWFFAYSAGAIL